MDLSLSEEQRNLKQVARKFLAEFCPDTLVREMEDDEKGFPSKLWKEMARLGWLGIVIPEEFGGAGMGFFDLTILLEEMGRACLPGPFFSTVVLGSIPIIDFGNDQQKKDVLPDIASGKIILTLAHSEPAICWTTNHVETEARPHGKGYLISGTKLFVPYAHIAHRSIISVNTEKGVSLFLLKSPAKGMQCILLQTLGRDKLCEVILNEVELKRNELLGDLDRGNDLLENIQSLASVAKCAEMVGGAQKVLEMTVQHAKEREQFGRPIGSFQAIQHYCADMLTDIDSARLLTYEAALQRNEGLPFSRQAAIAKAWVSGAYRRVTALGVQIHGGMGVTMEHNMQLYYRGAKEAEIFFGDADYFRERLARELID